MQYPHKAPAGMPAYPGPMYGQPMMQWPGYMMPPMQYVPAPHGMQVVAPQAMPAVPQQEYLDGEEEDEDEEEDYEDEIAEYGAGTEPESPKGPNSFTLLLHELQRAVANEGYTTPTPIQAQAIPHLLQGRDILGCAQTGTGKTAAFTLPMLQFLHKNPQKPRPRFPRALILAPTRELAAQIGDSITAYGRFLRIPHAVIFGGVGQEPQVQALLRGVTILVATPGRLLDLMQQGYIHLQNIEQFVLDEADRMLDMGFLPDVKRVISALPEKRHSLFFSATLEPTVVALANTLVRNPVHITVTPEQPTVERISQVVYFVDKDKKGDLLVHLLRDPKVAKVIVFTQMKHQANKVVAQLLKSGIQAVAIHGNKSQSARLQALAGFKANTVRVLAATDIAARGLDIDGVSHVVNYDLPNVPETYVHRIGRTGRAGAGGDSISFCAGEEREFLRDIERFIRRQIPVNNAHPLHSMAAQTATGAAARPPPKQQRGGRNGGGGGGGGHGGGGGDRGGGNKRQRRGGSGGGGGHKPAAAGGVNGHQQGQPQQNGGHRGGRGGGSKPAQPQQHQQQQPRQQAKASAAAGGGGGGQQRGGGGGHRGGGGRGRGRGGRGGGGGGANN